MVSSVVETSVVVVVVVVPSACVYEIVTNN